MKEIVKVDVIRTTGLAKLDAATQALSKATTFAEIKKIRDVAEAIRKLAKTAGAGLDIQNQGAMLKIRAERKAGKKLKTMERHKSVNGRPKKGVHDEPLILKELGIDDKNQSRRWQREADISDGIQEEYFEQARKKEQEITTAGFLRYGKPVEDKEFEPKIYDIWNFQGIDDKFGQEHPGNIPAGIVLNTLYYYTNENDLVVDPMAGGGVVIDCCKYLNRGCLAYDVKPTRKDIEKNDILQGYPAKAKDCNLIFLDPPYYKKKEEDYGKESISALTLEQYWMAFKKIAEHSFRCIDKSGFLALLMEPYIDYQDSTNSLWLFQYINLFSDNSWKVERIFDVPESSQRYAAHDVARAKEQKQILTLRRQLIIFRK